MVPFYGYKMPVQYPEGIKNEYYAVRNDIGMFDVSHMGEFEISGKGAESFLQKLTINNVKNLYFGKAQYTAMCNQNGGIIDDIILYKFTNKYLMVTNASNLEKNWKWLNDNLTSDTEIKNISKKTSLIAIQGPNSRKVLSNLFYEVNDLKYYHAIKTKINNDEIIISRTGYTGELGFEIYGSHSIISLLWKDLLNIGVQPCGLGVRDILRIEMKYCLYGNEINESINPLESGLSWITCLNKDFIGKNKILKFKQNNSIRNLISLQLIDRGIPRKGYKIIKNSNIIGEVCSGTQSIGLNCGIALGYVKNGFHQINSQISVMIRNKEIPAMIVKSPFIKNTSLFA